MCDVLAVSRSVSTRGRRVLSRRRTLEDAELVRGHQGRTQADAAPTEARAVRALRKQGKRVGKKRIERLMRSEGSSARRESSASRQTRSMRPIAPNVVQRQFEASAPNTVWVTDVTYVWTHEAGYLRRSWTSARDASWVGPRARTRTRSPSTRWRERRVRGCLCSAGPSLGPRKRLRQWRLPCRTEVDRCRASMSARATAGTMPSRELLRNDQGRDDRERDFETSRSERRVADYIGCIYNVTRMHSTIGYVSPLSLN